MARRVPIKTKRKTKAPEKTRIGLIGCGKMGKALLQGWVKSGLDFSYLIVDPSAPRQRSALASYIKRPDNNLKRCPVIVLAVKPQVMNKACESLKPFLSPRTLVISIAAGRSLESLQKSLGKNRPIIRTMPNLPAAIQKGVTVAVANKHATGAQKTLAHRLLSTVGHVEWINNEKLLDAVTAVSGSGPAYVFYLIETMAAAGRKLGLEEKLAMTLARQTVIGAAALAEAESQIPAAKLRAAVTSPGGTTEAALKILRSGKKMQKLFDEALKAAQKHGRELSV